MKKYLIMLLLPLMALCYSCVDDSSAYEAQQKEEVDIDDFRKPGEGGDETPEPGVLIPGIYEVKLNVEQPDGSTAQRRFKYYMPSTLVDSEPISLVFQFHGDVEYKAEHEPGDPNASLSASHSINQLAAKNNWITCFPISSRADNEDGSGKLDWTNTENELAFMDAIIDWFLASTPTIDADRIHGMGAEAGGSFLFQLALDRSDRFASIVPYSSTYKIPDDADIPERAVPVMMLVANKDTTDVKANMNVWAEKDAGYFESNRVLTTNVYEEDLKGYATLNTYTWRGAKADIDLYVLKTDVTDGQLNISRLTTYIAEFINAHPMDASAKAMYITAGIQNIEAAFNDHFEIPISYTVGATVELIGAPASWNPVLGDGILTLTAPADFSGDIVVKGEFYLKATLKDEVTGTTAAASTTIKFELKRPLDYFNVGDVYRNDAGEPVGVIVWVNPHNQSEGKIINLNRLDGYYQDYSYGNLGKDFESPDKFDGEGNTAAMVARNATLSTPYTDWDAVAFLLAHDYSDKGVTGWYLPAVDELAAIYPNLEIIQERLGELKVDLLSTSQRYYSSTSEIDETIKKVYYCVIGTGVTGSVNEDDILRGYIYARAFKKVTL